MNVLGIETATERLSAAILIEGTVHERHTDSRSSHCELIAGFIGELIEEAGATLNDIEGVAVSLGPGSFTGLRIGIATAMGIAYGLGLETAGVNTLQALAWYAAQPGNLVCPLIDAKRSEVYTGIYRAGEDDGIPDVVLEPCTVPVIKLADILQSYGKPLTITGPAAEQFRQELEGITGTPVTFIPPESAKPNAESIARLGSIMFQRGEGINPAALKPLYLRRSDAEIARDARH